jgi:hypothetical protein
VPVHLVLSQTHPRCPELALREVIVNGDGDPNHAPVDFAAAFHKLDNLSALLAGLSTTPSASRSNYDSVITCRVTDPGLNVINIPQGDQCAPQRHRGDQCGRPRRNPWRRRLGRQQRRVSQQPVQRQPCWPAVFCLAPRAKRASSCGPEPTPVSVASPKAIRPYRTGYIQLNLVLTVRLRPDRSGTAQVHLTLF